MTYWEKYISEEMTAADKKKAAEQVLSDLRAKKKGNKKDKKKKGDSPYQKYLTRQLEFKKQKYEDEKAEAYANTLINGPDPVEVAKAEAGLAQLKQSDELIQSTADGLQDTGAPPETVRAVRKLSKAQRLGRAMALADMAVPMYSQFLEDQYRNNDQLQIQFVNPDTGQVEVITPKTHMGPDQRAAVNKVLFKEFVK